MTNKERLKVGMKLYLQPTGNMARRTKEVKEVTVSKVGRKYFEVEELWRDKFAIDDLRDVTEYSNDWQGYFSLQELEDDEEYEELLSDLRIYFGSIGRNRNSTNLSLDQLRQIKEMIKR
ncbi:hypothetical protein Q7A53_05630 [Halobacillus rhizosphaerae]|uniref:beta barrel domain-containing protein n=1 Tax=Halobacillus rhizosphaerae TaxID=3064889 RepID=UPI00398B9A00